MRGTGKLSSIDIIICLNLFSVYKLNGVGDATHPCQTPCCIRILADNSFMVITDAV